MIAFVSTAGGCVEFRIYEEGIKGNLFRVERWCLTPHPSGDDRMTRDETYEPTKHNSTFRAMVSIALEF